MENVKTLLLGKTIEKVEFYSWQSPNDTMILSFTDKTSLKIMSDPNLCFDGLAFYTKKFVTVEEYEEVK